jgi:hypothetical protein
LTTSPKILVHLEQHIPSDLSLQSSSAAHFHGVTQASRHSKSASTAPDEQPPSFHHHVLISIRTRYSLHVTLLGWGWCRLASRGPGKPYTHDISPAHANSLSVLHYLFSSLALLFFDSKGGGIRRFSCHFRTKHNPRVELGGWRFRI